MSELDLKTLYGALRFLENPAEVKRKLPITYTHRPLKEGVMDLTRLLGGKIEPSPGVLAALIGGHRFGIFEGEPTTVDLVAHTFETARIIFTVVIDPGHFEIGGQAIRAHSTVPTHPHKVAEATTSPSRGVTAKTEVPAPSETANVSVVREFLSNVPHTGVRLFRCIFEFVLGWTTPSSIQSGVVAHANELLGRRELARVFLADVMYILGEQIDPGNVKCFLATHHLLGLSLLEYKLMHRDYCTAFYLFRRLQRAFPGPIQIEEQRLQRRIAALGARIGLDTCGVRLLESPSEEEKVSIDALDSAIDVVEVLNETIVGSCFKRAVSTDSSVFLRLIKAIASEFKKFGEGRVSAEITNREIGELLLAFGIQFGCEHVC